YHQQSRDIHANFTDSGDNVMLVRNRKSRIYYSQQFFDYPIKLNPDTLRKLGLIKVMRIGISYVKSTLFPIRNEKNLEEFFINRFGKELYLTFFKEYTEKVWGHPCNEISAEWGKQRIKGLSLRKALWHFIAGFFGKDDGIRQKKQETSLIERFLYPKLGPGQLWESVRDEVLQKGGKLKMNSRCTGIRSEGNKIQAVEITHSNGQSEWLEADYFFSTMPIKDLINGWQSEVPQDVKRVANGLEYRDFFTVGLLVDQLKISEGHHDAPKLIQDNWIYIQEPGVEIGRLQIFNNWSPYLVAKEGTVWLGLEYFCKESDEIWHRNDQALIELGQTELSKIGIIDYEAVKDACVIRMPKTYPAYFGSYSEFGILRSFLDQFENLFPVGRNGMHKYNNQDHSMLTAIAAVDNILAGRSDKSNLWEINTEEEYHEEK
ncbi:MAG: NAD(P)/FAD-dependent oxidoreductase, partial [Bacteroidota bacterium]|nr:NAD(P)/FAD-dependent oxidoreductase [Bacteroidota bacterium]MDX5430352.1 NAD(P)/FAD-dependent oxidoreductase [Bacteroidota bacterium]MDX5469113.1 NAD(P)/FAD-dependent oxidoreductase [Bacteroidota bacterium]